MPITNFNREEIIAIAEVFGLKLKSITSDNDNNFKLVTTKNETYRLNLDSRLILRID